MFKGWLGAGDGICHVKLHALESEVMSLESFAAGYKSLGGKLNLV